MFIAHKKTFLSILLSCTASLSQAQSVTIPVTLPDTLVKTVMQDHVIKVLNGKPVPQNGNTPATRPVPQPVQQPVQTVPRVYEVRKTTSEIPPVATPDRVFPEPIRQTVELVDTIRRVVVVDQQVSPQQTRSVEVRGRHIERVDRSELSATFIPKGQWMLGGTINFQEWDNNDTDFLVLKNMNLEGHTFSISPAFGYFVAKNTAIGLRYNYNRNYFFLGDFDLNLGEDLNISLKDLYYHQHKHEGCFFVRTYMPLFGSKTFGFFSEVRATYAQSIGKNSTGDPSKSNFDGVYEKSQSIGLGFTPGLCVFATNFAAVECSVGMLGVNYRWTDQKHYEDNADEPVYQKRSQSGGANFKFNMFSINIGMTLYL